MKYIVKVEREKRTRLNVAPLRHQHRRVFGGRWISGMNCIENYCCCCYGAWASVDHQLSNTTFFGFSCFFSAPCNDQRVEPGTHHVSAAVCLGWRHGVAECTEKCGVLPSKPSIVYIHPESRHLLYVVLVIFVVSSHRSIIVVALVIGVDLVPLSEDNSRAGDRLIDRYSREEVM